MSDGLKYCSSCQKDVLCEELGLSVVCTGCGLELERNQVSFSLEHFDKGAEESRSDVRDTSVRFSYLGSMRGQNKPISNYQQMYKNKVWTTARQIGRTLRQSDDFIGEVKLYAQRVLESNLPNPGVMRLVPACVYLVCRIRKSPISLLDVADACGQSPFHIGRWYRRLIERLKLEPPSERMPSMLVDDCVCRLINEATFAARQPAETTKTVKKLESADSDELFALHVEDGSGNDWDDMDIQGELGQLRQRVITTVQRVIKMASEQLLIAGRHPGPIAAAATLLVIKCYPETAPYANLQELLYLMHCKQGTIEKRTSELKSLLLKTAKANWPWGPTLTLSNLESKLSFIIEHLEIEARVASARIKLELQQSTKDAELDNSSTTTKQELTLPTIKSSHSKQSTAAQSLTATPFPTRPVSPSDIATQQPYSHLPPTSEEPTSDSATSSWTFNDAMEISEPISASDGIQSPFQSEIVDPTALSAPSRQPLRIKLGPSSLSRLFPHLPSEPNSMDTATSTHELSTHTSVAISIKPDPCSLTTNESAEPILLDSSSSITVCEPSPVTSSSMNVTVPNMSHDASVGVDDEKKVKPEEEKADVKRIRRHAVNFAPSFVKNATVKARRTIMIQRAKAKLAKLAETLTAEEANTFGLGRFKTMPINPKWEDSEEIITIDGSEPHEEFKQVTKTQLFKTSNRTTRNRFNQEQEQIERLLMEGVSDDQILAGYFAHQLEALDSKFNAVTEQFTDCTEGLIRTSAEIELLREMEVDWESTADKDEEDEEDEV